MKNKILGDDYQQKIHHSGHQWQFEIVNFLQIILLVCTCSRPHTTPSSQMQKYIWNKYNSIDACAFKSGSYLISLVQITMLCKPLLSYYRHHIQPRQKQNNNKTQKWICTHFNVLVDGEVTLSTRQNTDPRLKEWSTTSTRKMFFE